MTPDPLVQSGDLPSQNQVAELLEGEFARAGYEIDEVVIDHTGRPPRITVVADGDHGLDLDALAGLSRAAAERLDSFDRMGDTPYVLEVTSRGVDRPLTTEKHYRRARGRKVDLTLADGAAVTGRLGEADADAVHVVVRVGKDFEVRRILLGDIVKAVVQVEFSAPSRRELELAGVAGKGAGE